MLAQGRNLLATEISARTSVKLAVALEAYRLLFLYLYLNQDLPQQPVLHRMSLQRHCSAAGLAVLVAAVGADPFLELEALRLGKRNLSVLLSAEVSAWTLALCPCPSLRPPIFRTQHLH